MTERSPGAGWWLARDGNWYPPDLHPDVLGHTAKSAPGPPPGALATGQPAAIPPAAIPPAAVQPNLRTPSLRSPSTATPSSSEAPVPRPSLEAKLPSARQTAPRVPTPVRPAQPRPSERPPESTALSRRTPAARRRGVLVGAAAASAAVVGAAWIARPGQRAELSNSPAVTAAAVGTSTASTPGSTPTAGRIPVNALTKGTCIDEPNLGDGIVASVPATPCTSGHTHEVYHVAIYDETTTYSAERIEAFADDLCVREFRRYLGIDYARSKYTYLAVLPTEETWNRDRDRSVLCLAYADGARLSVSLANIQQ